MIRLLARLLTSEGYLVINDDVQLRLTSSSSIRPMGRTPPTFRVNSSKGSLSLFSILSADIWLMSTASSSYINCVTLSDFLKIIGGIVPRCTEDRVSSKSIICSRDSVFFCRFVIVLYSILLGENVCCFSLIYKGVNYGRRSFSGLKLVLYYLQKENPPSFFTVF